MVRILITLIPALAVAGCRFADQTDLEVTAPKTSLRMGETVQLSVTQTGPGGSTPDITRATAGTTYFTTSESMLIPEPDGKVTCIGTNGRNQESAVIGVGNGARHGHLRFRLVSPGPGPGLEVIADKTVLHEAESVQLHVFKSLPGGGRKDLTSRSIGTRYLTFAGNAFPDSSAVTLSDSGMVSAVLSIGQYTHRTVIVFVRNQDSVGWIELRVVRT